MRSRWGKRQHEFYHSWLNKYIIEIGYWLSLLDEKTEDTEMLDTFIVSILPLWEEHIEEVETLIQEFELEMSPRTLFNSPPLSNCDSETAEWLGNLIHNLWFERYSVKDLINNATLQLETTVRSYNELKLALSVCSDTRCIECLKPYHPLFSDFLDACHSLSDAIAKFPSEVKTV